MKCSAVQDGSRQQRHAGSRDKIGSRNLPGRFLSPRHSSPRTPSVTHTPMSSSELFCYHCGRYHPREEMRQIETKGKKRWRCIKSIEAAQRNVAQRDAFGQTVRSTNRSENQARLKARATAERLAAGG